MAYKRVKKDKKPYVLTIVGLILLILISSQTEGLAQTGSNLANTIFSPFEKVTYSISSAIISSALVPVSCPNIPTDLTEGAWSASAGATSKAILDCL